MGGRSDGEGDWTGSGGEEVTEEEEVEGSCDGSEGAPLVEGRRGVVWWAWQWGRRHDGHCHEVGGQSAWGVADVNMLVPYVMWWRDLRRRRRWGEEWRWWRRESNGVAGNTKEGAQDGVEGWGRGEPRGWGQDEPDSALHGRDDGIVEIDSQLHPTSVIVVVAAVFLAFAVAVAVDRHTDAFVSVCPPFPAVWPPCNTHTPSLSVPTPS